MTNFEIGTMTSPSLPWKWMTASLVVIIDRLQVEINGKMQINDGDGLFMYFSVDTSTMGF
jgi:hypothetical protein